ncbi:MAG: gamma-glutamyltransferase, partial [Paracoccaceae bacterium]
MKILNNHHYPSRRSPVVAKNMVAASQPLAVQAGLKMLSEGGNAVDAAVATAITLTLVEPTGCGLGSDAFAIVWDGTRLHGLNASGPSPAKWSYDRFAKLGGIPFRGWESVTVPGAVAGWAEVSTKFGKLPFEKLFEVAIKYARDGFPVSPVISHLWARGAAELKDQPGFAQNFLKQGNAPYPGEIYQN